MQITRSTARNNSHCSFLKSAVLLYNRDFYIIQVIVVKAKSQVGGRTGGTVAIKQHVASYHTTKIIAQQKPKIGCHGNVP